MFKDSDREIWARKKQKEMRKKQYVYYRKKQKEKGKKQYAYYRKKQKETICIL